jgi:two-component system nitrogen regulation response regulator GlnG
MPTVLAIDDDRAVLHLIDKAFAKTPISVLSTSSVGEGFELIKKNPDVVLLDIRMPEASGLELARRIQSLDAKLPVIFVTACDNSETAIEAMKLGAYDYLLKPIDLPKLRDCVDRAIKIRRMMHVPVRMVGGDSDDNEYPEARSDHIVGHSPQMQDVFKAIGRVAPQNVTVLILGESGTGKELVARAIYHHSPRKGKPFLAVNCAAIPETLLESELFGHEKGSFTNAHQRRIGKFEQCSGGTIFLDEVGDMSALVQSKVLRVLQEQAFERVGGTETVQTGVRVITATNRDLPQLVAGGQFREDLYYRLNGFTIKVPPLRDRGNDIALLLAHSLRRFAAELGKDVHAMSPDAMELLLRYPWPGNVRELEAVVRQSLLQSTGPVVLQEFLPESIRYTGAVSGKIHPGQLGSSDLEPLVSQCLREGSHELYAQAMERMDRYVLTRILRHTNGNQSWAAKLLGITRASLRRKLHTLKISVESAISLKSNGEQERETSSV